MSAIERDKLDCVVKSIEALISRSGVPEDPLHSKNTLEWLLRLRPDADEALKTAALGHDIERAVEGRKVKRADFSDFESFKEAHARNSAGILREIMLDCGTKDARFIERVHTLVSNHESGGDPDSNLLRDADALSFFDVNLPLYFERNGWQETKRRALWGYRRLSAGLRPLIARMSYKNKDLHKLLREVINEAHDKVLRPGACKS